MLGIVGGMGPLASAEFVKTLYQETICGPEQASPALILLSDPSMPDRTSAISAGELDLLAARLTESLRTLESAGATQTVICCFTIHAVLPRIPAHLRRRLISLVGVALEETIARGEGQLLLCTAGSRRARIFEAHQLWPRAERLIVLPKPADQDCIHEMILRIKENHVSEAIAQVQTLMSAYRVRSFIAGCTEFHLVAKQLAGNTEFACIDPLLSVIRAIGAGGQSAVA